MRFCVRLWYDQGYITYVSNHDLTCADAEKAAKGWVRKLGIRELPSKIEVERMV